jgi:hypothetical protein
LLKELTNELAYADVFRLTMMSDDDDDVMYGAGDVNMYIHCECGVATIM